MKRIIIILFCFAVIFTGYKSVFAQQDQDKEYEAFFVAKKAFDDGFYDVSLSLFERFIENFTSSSQKAQASLYIGECFFYQNKFLDALNKFEELKDQQFAEKLKDAVTYWIAEVHFRGNNFAKAIQYYQAIIDNFPKSEYLAAAYYSLGWCYFQEQDFNKAVNYFRAVEEKFPRQMHAQDAAFKIVECFYNLKDYAKVKEKARSYFKAYPQDDARQAYLYFYSAEADYYLNNFTEAIDSYKISIAKTADSRMKALSKLGVAWSSLKLKQYPQASENFDQVKAEDLEKRSVDVLLLGKAILYFETNKFGQAKDVYLELANKAADPIVVIQAYLGMADSLYNLAEYDEALKSYNQAVEHITPDLSVPGEITDRLHYGLAWVFVKKGEFKEAIKEFQKIVKSSEDKIVKISALCQIGDAYQDSGDYPKALSTYDEILQDYPDTFYSDYVQYQIGATMLKASNYDGAILSFLKFKKSFLNSALLDDAVYSLGLAYFQKQDYESSYSVFKEFSDKFKDSNILPQAMYLEAISLYNLAKYTEAIESFKEIIRLYQQDLELVQKSEYEIADCYYQLGNEKEAMARFKNLRTKYPDSSLTGEIVWWLGEYYYRHGDLNMARRYFLSLIQDFSKSNLVADAHYILGSISMDEGKYKEALDSFKKAMELGSSDLSGQAAIAIADIYIKEDSIDLALSTYQEVVNRYPNLAHIVYPKSADALCKQGKFEEGIVFYRKALDIVS
ncbi:tetratricopeptide repeat protein, partial [bacterium]